MTAKFPFRYIVRIDLLTLGVPIHQLNSRCIVHNLSFPLSYSQVCHILVISWFMTPSNYGSIILNYNYHEYCSYLHQLSYLWLFAYHKR